MMSHKADAEQRAQEMAAVLRGFTAEIIFRFLISPTKTDLIFTAKPTPLHVCLLRLDAMRACLLQRVRHGKVSLAEVDEYLPPDKNFLLAALSADGKVLRFLPKALRSNMDFISAALEQDFAAMEYISAWDKTLVLRLVERRPLALQYASKNLRSNTEVVLAAVRKDGSALHYASERRRADRECVLAAVNQNWQALQWSAQHLRADKDIILAAVKQNSSALAYAVEELQNDVDIVCAAMTKDTRVLKAKHPSSPILCNKASMLAIVAQDGLALRYACKKLRSDLDVVGAAIKQNKRALRHAERDAVTTIVSRDGRALRHAGYCYKNDPALIAIVAR